MDWRNYINEIYIFICGIFGVVGAWLFNFLNFALGGFDKLLGALIFAMVMDYASGIMVALVFGKSPKTEGGGLESRAGFKGLCRKVFTLALVAVAVFTDMISGTDFLRKVVVIAFIANEFISIIENAGLMGVWIPAPLKNAIELLKNKSELLPIKEETPQK